MVRKISGVTVETDFSEATKEPGSRERQGVYITVNPAGRYQVRHGGNLVGLFISVDNALRLVRKTLTGRETVAADELGSIPGKGPLPETALDEL